MTHRSMAARRTVLIAGCVMLAACMDLNAPNNNNPDRVRATNTPGDVQALIAGTFQRWWPNVYNTTPTVMFGSMGYEFSTPFLCFAGQPMEQEPRPSWNNSSAFTNANVSGASITVPVGARFIPTGSADPAAEIFQTQSYDLILNYKASAGKKGTAKK